MKKLARALFDRDIGKTLAISLFYALCWSMFIYAYQPFAAKALLLTPQEIAINFTVFGIAGLLSQAFAVSRLVKMFGEKKVLFGSLVFMTVSFILFSKVTSFSMLMAVSLFHAFGNSLVSPLVQALLSKEADESSQGSILGINASYMSIGMIFGPIIGGILATNQIQLPFIGGAVLAFVCAVFAYKILSTPHLHQVKI
ncbi:MFS transporter, partial [Candidatus Gottesmanbacteria bacterium]|nr:MFS transporter [Candidatus Gottesmanbacteria bacterium]